MRTAKQRKEALDLVRAGMSYAEAGRRTGIAGNTIRFWSVQAGLPPSRKPITFEPGQIIGNWQVIGEAKRNGPQKKRWVCKCLLCQENKLVLGESLKYGWSTKCANCSRRETGVKAREKWKRYCRSPEWHEKRKAVHEKQRQNGIAFWAKLKAERAAKAAAEAGEARTV